MSRERNEPGSVERNFAVLDWHCLPCMTRTGKPHRIGQVLRQRCHEQEEWQEWMARVFPGRAPHAGYQGDLHAVFDATGRLVALEAQCQACANAGGLWASVRPQRLWTDLDAELAEMRSRGEHRRVVTPADDAETLGEPPPATASPPAHERAEKEHAELVRQFHAGEIELLEPPVEPGDQVGRWPSTHRAELDAG